MFLFSFRPRSVRMKTLQTQKNIPFYNPISQIGIINLTNNKMISFEFYRFIKMKVVQIWNL